MITIVTAAWTTTNLPKTIESIDNQTYADWHHIIVNDNNEEIRELLHDIYDFEEKRRWIDLGFRTHYYGALARNIGVIAAFSYVHAKDRDIDNEWVIFHDDDNLWKPNHLALMVQAAQANPHATMIASDAVWVGEKDNSWKETRECKIRHGGCDLGQFMYKTKLFRQYGYFFPHPRHKHKYDWELISKMAEGEGDRLVYTHQPTFIMNYKKR